MAEIFRDSAFGVDLGVAGATEITAVFVRNGVDVHSAVAVAPMTVVPVPWKIYGYDGPFQVRWEFFVPNDLALHTRYESHEVITPLVSLGLTPTADDIKAERLVRRIIETLTGQSFGFSFGSMAISGDGSRVLPLPQRIIRLEGISLNQYPYDSIPFGPVKIVNNGYGLATGYGDQYLTVKHAPPDDTIFSANGAIVAPGYIHHWNNQATYIITGSFGYEGVPVEIAEAAAILIEDYNCDEDAYRNKFIDNMRAADWRIEYNARTWNGTGNIKADQLIAPYIRSGIGVI